MKEENCTCTDECLGYLTKTCKGIEEEKQIKCYCGHTTYCDCSPLEKPKQETLEEVAERLYPENIESIMDGYHDSNSYQRKSFINGYKLAKERSYSEEEVETLLETLSKVLVYQGNEYRLPHYFEYEIEQVIKQFKKK